MVNKPKKRIKPLIPSLREKKRFMVFEIISKYNINSINSIEEAITNALHKFVGISGASKAGIKFLSDKFNEKKLKGIIRVSNKGTDLLRGSFCLIKEIDNKPVIVRSVGLSGILKKAESSFM